MSYIFDILKGTIEAPSDRISLERYLLESGFVNQYLSRVVQDQAMVVYHVLFHISWFKTGKGDIAVPWATVGSHILSVQGNPLDAGAVKRRLPDLVGKKCIAIRRLRGNANEISVHLPTDIPVCRQLIDQDLHDAQVEDQQSDERDYYSDTGRRLAILSRDHHACVYCTAVLADDTFVLDHLLPVAKGGTNKKHNLVAACESCNGRRSDSEPIQFLRENYRQQLLTQEEFLQQRAYIEALLGESAG